MKKVLVIGSINMDLITHINYFPNPGETVIGQKFSQHPGGKGANQASAVAKQNIPTTFFGKVGNDNYGSILSKTITDLGINTQLHTVETNTGLALIEIDQTGENRIVIIPGANGTFTKDDILKHHNLLEEHDIIIIQLEIPIEVCSFIAQEAKQLHKTVILNPAPAAILGDAFLKNIDYLIPNEHELGIIAEMPTDTENQIEEAVKYLQSKGVSCVIVTLGEKGYCSFDGEKVRFYPLAIEVDPIDTTGAGDSFVGAFAGYIAKDYPIEEALIAANIAASISVTRFGGLNSAGSEEEILIYRNSL